MHVCAAYVYVKTVDIWGQCECSANETMRKTTKKRANACTEFLMKCCALLLVPVARRSSEVKIEEWKIGKWRATTTRHNGTAKIGWNRQMRMGRMRGGRLCQASEVDFAYISHPSPPIYTFAHECINFEHFIVDRNNKENSFRLPLRYARHACVRLCTRAGVCVYSWDIRIFIFYDCVLFGF